MFYVLLSRMAYLDWFDTFFKDKEKKTKFEPIMLIVQMDTIMPKQLDIYGISLNFVPKGLLMLFYLYCINRRQFYI